MSTIQLTQNRQLGSVTNLIEPKLTQPAYNQSNLGVNWEDLQGLSWAILGKEDEI